MAKKNQKKYDLSNTINDIKRNINSGLDELTRRVDALEASDAYNSMAIRNIQIQIRAHRGEKQTDIANYYGLSEGRISQIVKQ